MNTQTAQPVSQPSAQAITWFNQAVARFETVIAQIEPVAEAECRKRTRGVNCDYLVAVDNRKDQPPNAFHALDADNRPVIAFTLSLLMDVRNDDELALITAHEAAHHILGHIKQTEENAAMGAVLLGLVGLPQLGAEIGARSHAKDFEIEADRLGTQITKKAGFDPIRGLAYFERVPDPGNRFLGTHPPHEQRISTIREAGR